MTIDEAIKHVEEVANDMELCCEECAEDHRQLAEYRDNGSLCGCA